jgi:hypothetical protein
MKEMHHASDKMTIEELKRHFDGEWVLLQDVDEDVNGRIESGYPLAHGASLEDVLGSHSRKLPKRSALLSFKEFPQDSEFVF